MDLDEPLGIHTQELRRGTVVVAVLALLDEPRYGYALLQDLAEAGIAVDANTLYPLLRRLEKQGLLTSAWNTEESRPRKFYALADQGHLALDALSQEWRAIRTSLDRLLRKAQP